MEFEWDAAKAASNLQKHGVGFERALKVFGDPDRIDFDVSRDLDGEVRRKVVGRVSERLLAVVYTVRGEAVRLISARQANDQERRRYGYR